MAIASEIDRLGPEHEDKPDFGFFRRTSAGAMRRHSAAERTQRRGLAAIPCADRRRPAAARFRRGHRNRRAEDVFGRQTVQTRQRPLEGAFPANQPAAPGVAQEVRACSTGNSGAVGGRTIERMLFVPFRPGTAHIVIVGPVFPARPVPGWAEKRQHRSGDAAQKDNQKGYSEPCSWHVTLDVKRRTRIGGPDGPPSHHERSVGGDSRVTQLLLGRSRRIPRSSSSRSMRRSFASAIASIMFFR